MTNPIEALEKARKELVEVRRDRIVRNETIADTQAEIEAVDRALADERAMQDAAEGSPSRRAKELASRPGFGEPSDADEA